MTIVNIIGGSVEEKRPDVQEYAHEIRPHEFVAVHGEIVATIKCYLSDDDVVREYHVRGVIGEIREWEPALEDRQMINAQIIAELLTKNDFDMHDVKELMEFYLANNGGTSTYALDDKVQRAHHQLGGME